MRIHCTLHTIVFDGLRYSVLNFEVRLHYKCNDLDVLYNIATVTSRDVHVLT